MLTTQELAALRAEYADVELLSVYIDADANDPGERTSWRRRLTAALDDLERDHGAPGVARARALLEAELAAYTGFLPGRGWSAFITPEQVLRCEQLPARMPDLVRWRRGPLLGPYLRALKQLRPIVLALVDGRRGRVFRYVEGKATEDVDLRADAFIDDLTDRNMSKRAATTTGTRGETGTDAADRMLAHAAEQMHAQVAATLLNVAGSEGLVVLGGPTAAVGAMERLLAPKLGDRLLVNSSLQFTAGLPEVGAAMKEAASTLSMRLQAAEARAMLDAAHTGGRGAMGAEACTKAAETGQIDTLLLTPTFARAREDDAEVLIGEVLAHGGSAEIASSLAADLLDDDAQGVAASLRFVLAVADATAPPEAAASPSS